MSELLAENWIVLALALVIGLFIAWWLFAANRKTTIARTEDTGNVTGAARRNQALIDAPGAATGQAVPPPTLQGLAGSGAAVAAAAAPATPAPAPSPTGDDDLTRIKGVGPKLQKLLREQGVTSFAQIAAWDDAEVDRIDAQLGNFAGRIRRDDWRAQAALLAAGDTAGYEARFGRL